MIQSSFGMAWSESTRCLAWLFDRERDTKVLKTRFLSFDAWMLPFPERLASPLVECAKENLPCHFDDWVNNFKLAYLHGSVVFWFQSYSIYHSRNESSNDRWDEIVEGATSSTYTSTDNPTKPKLLVRGKKLKAWIRVISHRILGTYALRSVRHPSTRPGSFRFRFFCIPFLKFTFCF